MRHADVEEEIVERGVHQRKGKEEPPVAGLVRLERPPTATRNGQDYQASRSKTDAGKEHLAARHVRSDAKGSEAHLDKWKCPSPRYCCRQGKYHHPYGSLEYGCSRLVHLTFRLF